MHDKADDRIRISNLHVEIKTVKRESMRKNLKTTYPGNAWFAALASLLLLVMQFGFPALSDAGPRVPKAVTLSAALSSTGSQVNLSWTSPDTTPTGFLIERSQQASSGYVQVGAVSGSAASATDAPGGTTGSYYYRVRGYVTLGSKTYYSDYSNVAGVTLTAAEPTDDAAPSVIISSPETDLQVNNEQTLTVIAAASDNVKVTRVDFYNGSALIGSDTTNTFSASLPLNKDNNGTHSIYAVAHDAAGNSSKSASVNVVVDIVDTVESPTTESYPAPVLDAVTVDGSNFVLKWSVPSSASGLPEGGYDLVIDGVDTGSTHRTTATSATISGLEAGVAHTFMVEARWTQAEPDEFPRSNQVQGMIEASSDAGTTDTATRQPMSLRGNPSFDAAQLPEEARLWYQRLWASIENSNQYLNATTLAESNDTYNYARPLNTHITSLLHAFRMTGDLRLLDEIDRLAQIMRSKLKDWSILVLNGTTYQADGYLNWLYFYDAGYEGTDIHQMDEMLSHSLVAAFAYAFHANRDLDSRYAERATFWTGYLKNHFEAKWRKRKGIATGFPFLTKLLTHVYVQWIRYHYYMHKLTGEDGYYNEAVRLSQDIKNHMEYVGTPLGTTAQWDHGMPELGGSTLGPQPTNYARYTMQGMADLAFENFSIFDNDSLLTSVANTAAYYVLNSKAPSAIAYYIDGSGEQTDDLYVISPFTAMAYWDASGKIVNLSTQIFQNIEGDETTPRRIYVPAGLFLNAMKNK